MQGKIQDPHISNITILTWLLPTDLDLNKSKALLAAVESTGKKTKREVKAVNSAMK